MEKVFTEQSQNEINQPKSTCKKRLCIVLTIIIINFITISLTVFLIKKEETPTKIQSQVFTSLSQKRISQQQQITFPLTPVYIWLGPIPQKHIQRIKKFKYPFHLIQNCDKLLNRLEEQFSEKFSDFIYSRVEQKSDLCRYAYLYYYGGLYLDLDTELDYECMQKFLKDQSLFFQRNKKTKGLDLFTIYADKPGNQYLKRAISFQNTFREFFYPHTKLFYMIPSSAYNVSTSHCVKHYAQQSWK